MLCSIARDLFCGLHYRDDWSHPSRGIKEENCAFNGNGDRIDPILLKKLNDKTIATMGVYCGLRTVGPTVQLRRAVSAQETVLALIHKEMSFIRRLIETCVRPDRGHSRQGGLLDEEFGEEMVEIRRPPSPTQLCETDSRSRSPSPLPGNESTDKFASPEKNLVSGPSSISSSAASVPPPDINFDDPLPEAISLKDFLKLCNDHKIMYDMEKPLGSGAFGKVYLGCMEVQSRWGPAAAGKDRIVLIPVAVKFCFTTRSRNAQKIIREIRVADKLDHPNIVRTILTAGPITGMAPPAPRRGVSRSPAANQSLAVAMVMENLSGGILRDWRERHGPDWSPPFPMLRSVLRDLLRGLRYIQAGGLEHGDIKEDNCALDGHGRAKWIDLGNTHRAFQRSTFTEDKRTTSNRVHFTDDMNSFSTLSEILYGKDLKGRSLDMSNMDPNNKDLDALMADRNLPLSQETIDQLAGGMDSEVKNFCLFRLLCTKDPVTKFWEHTTDELLMCEFFISDPLILFISGQ